MVMCALVKLTVVSDHPHSLYVLDGVQHQEEVVHGVPSRHEVVDDRLCCAAVGLVPDAFKGADIEGRVHGTFGMGTGGKQGGTGGKWYFC